VLDKHISRRDFVRDSAIAAAGIAAGMAMAKAAEPQKMDKAKVLSYNEQMEYRRLGKTGLWVSAVCLGGHWKRVEVMKQDLDKNRAEVVSRCIDAGINYIDACTGGEVMAYSKALQGRRDKMHLGYSWYEKEARSPEWRSTRKLLQSLDEGLKEAKLDYVDLWRITALEPGGDHTPQEREDMIAALDAARKSGKARFTGMSSHDRKWLKMMIEKYPDQMQVVVTPYFAKSKEKPTDSLFDAVRKCDVGIFGIKPFASNSLFKGDSSPNSPDAEEDDKRARLTIRYILCNDAITAPIPGLISIHQVDNVVKAVKERRELDLAEAAELQQAADEIFAKLPREYQWLKDWEYV